MRLRHANKAPGPAKTSRHFTLFLAKLLGAPFSITFLYLAVFAPN